jgi:ABC-2 type transport system permease protein
VGYIPVTIYLGKRPGTELWAALAVQVAWAVGLYLAGIVVWRRSMRQVIVQGG